MRWDYPYVRLIYEIWLPNIVQIPFAMGLHPFHPKHSANLISNGIALISIQMRHPNMPKNIVIIALHGFDINMTYFDEEPH